MMKRFSLADLVSSNAAFSRGKLSQATCLQ